MTTDTIDDDVPDPTKGLVLDHATHTYRHCGRRVGGVSEILQALGIADGSWFSEFAARRGTAVHLAVEYLLRGQLDEASVDVRIRGYVDAARQFLDQAGLDTSSAVIETPVWHPQLLYAGKPDLVGVLFARQSVVDWKSGGTGFAGLSTAAYEWAYRAAHGIRTPLRRLVVQLKEDGTFKMTAQKDANDYTIWAAAVQVFNAIHLPRIVATERRIAA